MFHKYKKDTAAGTVPGAAEAQPQAASVERPYEVPGGLRRLGLASWLLVGLRHIGRHTSARRGPAAARGRPGRWLTVS